MNRLRLWRQNFNWRMLLVRILVNMLSLLFAVGLLPNVYFVDRRVIDWILLSLMLGLLNAFVKPIIAFLTLRFIFATAGLVLAVINAIILWMLSWIFPSMLRVDSLFAALLGGFVLGLSSAFLEALFGLNPPIVAEKYPEIRERIKDRQFYRTRMVPARIAAKSQLSAGELEGGTEMEPAALPALTHKTADDMAQATAAADDNKVSLASTATEPEA
jgi:putative membrane protein